MLKDILQLEYFPFLVTLHIDKVCTSPGEVSCHLLCKIRFRLCVFPFPFRYSSLKYLIICSRIFIDTTLNSYPSLSHKSDHNPPVQFRVQSTKASEPTHHNTIDASHSIPIPTCESLHEISFLRNKNCINIVFGLIPTLDPDLTLTPVDWDLSTSSGHTYFSAVAAKC